MSVAGDSPTHHLLNLKISDTTFESNEATWGGAVYVQGEGSLTLENVTFSKNSGRYGSAMMIYGNKPNEEHLAEAKTATVIAKNVDFIGNTTKGAGAGAALWLYTKTNYTQTEGSFVNNSVSGTGSILGNVFVKGATAVFNDVLFEGNTAESSDGIAAGGAVYVDIVSNNTAGGVHQDGSVTFNITKDMTYSGNNVAGKDEPTDTYGYLTATAGGFLFLDRGTSATFNIDDATLTIGQEDASGHMDSIASAYPQTSGDTVASIIKTGSGTLTINSDLNRYYGTLAVKNGRMEVNKTWSIRGDVTVDGGTLALTDFNFNKMPDPHQMVGSITVNKGGTLETSSDQVFTKALGDGTASSAEDLKSEKLVLNEGTLALTDSIYNLAYAKTAGSLFSNGKVLMLGDLIESDQKKNEVSVEEIAGIGNVTLAEATVKSDKDVQIGGTKPTGDAVEYSSTGFGAADFDLGAANAITVAGGETLTLLGRGEDGAIVRTTGTDPVEVVVQTQSTLELGGVGAQGGTLTGKAEVQEGGTLLIHGNGKYTVQKVEGSGLIAVGSNEHAGNAVIKNLSDFTGLIFVDPEWKDGANPVSAASHLVLEEALPLGSYLVSARNSMSIIGGTVKESDDAFNAIARAASLSWKDDVTAAVFTKNQITFKIVMAVLCSATLYHERQGGLSMRSVCNDLGSSDIAAAAGNRRELSADFGRDGGVRRGDVGPGWTLAGPPSRQLSPPKQSEAHPPPGRSNKPSPHA